MRTLILICGLALAACSPAAAPAKQAEAPPPPPPKPPTEAEAIAVVNAVPTALMAGDVNGAVALYASDAVMFDPMSNDPITTKEANIASTNDFMKSGVTKFSVNSQKAQILDADNFVVTTIMTADMKVKGKPVQQVFRLTDVGHKQADGKWLLVNEHLSAAPAPVKAPLPVTATFEPKKVDAPTKADTPKPK